MIDARVVLERTFEAAVAAAQPQATLAGYLPTRPKGQTIVVGAGKASSQMAAALEAAWDGPLEGLVVTRYGFATPCSRIEIAEAAHPVPDEAGLALSQRLLDMVSGLDADDLVIALISGGGSALLPAPAGALTLSDEIAVNEALLASGAPIGVLNVIRKHVSNIKGGRLAVAAYPARVVTLVVSDIPGDDPALVASGPTLADPADRALALRYIDQFGMKLPAHVLDHIGSAIAAAPLPDDPRLERNEVRIVASADLSLEAAAAEAGRHGIEAIILSDAIEGEARDIGSMHAAIARRIATRNRPFQKPVLLLSGGETTVTLRGRGGRGGRNGEFMLAFALGIEGVSGIDALAADTDGIDGSEQNAGAFANGQTIAAIRARGLDAASLLAANDSWAAFAAANSLFVTGPTGTNVNDFRAVLIQ